MQAREEELKMGLKEKLKQSNYRAPMVVKEADISWIMSDKPKHASVVLNVNTRIL